MLIALDYDDTYSLDGNFWDQVVEIGRRHGHEFVCVTGRSEPPGSHERCVPMPVVCAPSEFKRQAAARAGFVVDVWIDNEPGTVEPARILEF